MNLLEVIFGGILIRFLGPCISQDFTDQIWADRCALENNNLIIS